MMPSVDSVSRAVPSRRSLLAAFAVALHLASPSLHAQATSTAEPGRLSFDFGMVIQGTVVSHPFVFQNTGTTPLRILGVDLTPGLRIDSIRAQLEPGEQVDLPVSFDTTGMRGPYEGKLTLRLNDPARPVAVFVLTGVVVPRVEFRPYAAFFLSGDRRAPAEASIEIVNHQETPLRITRIEHPVDRFAARLDPLEEGKRYRLSIALRTDAAAGLREDVIALHTDEGRILRVVANTRLRERVYTFPVEVDLGRLSTAATQGPESVRAAAQTLMVYQVEGKDFQAKFSADVPGLLVSAERGPKGDRWQATITLDPSAAKAGPLRGSIIIETNDSEFPRLVVPVTGSILANE
jgi:Protein of unknown function (DUF1573)